MCYGYIDIPKSEYRYLDLPESKKVEMKARKGRRRRRRKTRSTAENSSEGVTIIEGNNVVKVDAKTNEPKGKPKTILRQQAEHSLHRKPKKVPIIIEWNGGKTLEDDEQALIKRLN